MNIPQDLYSQALGLPAEQRSELALILLESLPDDGDRSPTLDADYEDELHRRLEEIDSGRAKLLSLEEVMSRLRSSRRATPSP